MLDGAGLEQIGAQVKRALDSRWNGRRPEPWFPRRDGRPVVPLRNWDDTSDRVSVELGYRLYTRYPTSLSESAVRDLVLAHIFELTHESP